MSNDFWINSFDHFWTQRNRWAEAIKNPKSDYQLYEDRAVRKDSVAYWLCKHPVTQEKLLERDGH